MITNMKDLEIQHHINAEALRQQSHIELIASENYVSRDVLEAQGSVLTNKYAEGYPDARYYGGCEHVDAIETLAIERAKLLFECEFANVQPHSGSQANSAVYAALLEHGDTILAMKLSHGGHLTHGHFVNFSGKTYDFKHYGVGEDGKIDMDELEKLAEEIKPKAIVAGYSAYSFELDYERFREIADKVGAYLIVDMAHNAGFVAGGFHKNPVKHAHVVTSTTHKTLRGPRGGLILSDCGDETIYNKLNKSVFPGQQGGPLMHVIAAKAVAFKEAMTYDYRVYISEVRALARMSIDILNENGIQTLTNTTDNHMFMIDLRSLEDDLVTGQLVQEWLEAANITTNKNTLPTDTSAIKPMGVRIGLSAITSRGFNEYEVGVVMKGIADIINARGDKEITKRVKDEVTAIALNKPSVL